MSFIWKIGRGFNQPRSVNLRDFEVQNRGWKPYRTAIGAVLFGFLEALVPRLQTYGFDLSPYLVKIAPYLITILVLVILTIYKEGKTGAPGNIGRPFFRENR